ncbi:hypothetical protein MIND_00921100 [Mycena indigotica]|uniref:G domain-containing protein n=1 Tax=Mycena indigotica TaxID=2126181 RepID=A0A8H6SCF6_9AGAR|nr:uncharacterized protein MIND_00921100 [Mycena indigotica]KAF7296893.1 hypothetical protein MIND_00921100 [Mycena indigotica]
MPRNTPADHFWGHSRTRSSEQCPHLHLLVVGARGIGKTALVRHALAGPESEFQITVHSNNDEWVTPGWSSLRNPRLVVHEISYIYDDEFTQEEDSIPGLNKLEIVQQILKEKTTDQSFMDQIHVIWFCIEVPASSNRPVFTPSDLVFLASQNVPIVVVFTRFDLLIADLEERLSLPDNISDESADGLTVQRANAQFLAMCMSKLAELDYIASHARTGGLKTATIDAESINVIRKLVETTCYLADEYVERKLWESERTRISQDRDGPWKTIAEASESVMDVYYEAVRSNIPWSSLGNTMDRLHRTITRKWKLDDPHVRRDDTPFVSQVHQLSTTHNPHRPESDKPSWLEAEYDCGRSHSGLLDGLLDHTKNS